MKFVTGSINHLRAVGITVAVASFLTAGCVTDPFTGESQLSNSAQRAGIATVIGGITILANEDLRNASVIEQVLVMSAFAGLGFLSGVDLDRQEAVLRAELEAAGVDVDRRGNNIVLNMARAVRFDVGSTRVRQQDVAVVEAVAKVLIEFGRTEAVVYGHTDDRGGKAVNQSVSEQRALSVATVLVGAGVAPGRLFVVGMGDSEPLVPNVTAAGRAENRRVEIHIRPRI